MKYRENVCAVIRNGNSVLICHRIDSSKSSGWQFPQGGINPENDLIDEMKRELLEEIGTEDVKVIRVLPEVYTYDFPENLRIGKLKEYKGQRQRWILCEFIDEKPNINLSSYKKPEFDDWAWVKPGEALKRIVDFKKDVYKKALCEMGLI